MSEEEMTHYQTCPQCRQPHFDFEPCRSLPKSPEPTPQLTLVDWTAGMSDDERARFAEWWTAAEGITTKET